MTSDWGKTRVGQGAWRLGQRGTFPSKVDAFIPKVGAFVRTKASTFVLERQLEKRPLSQLRRRSRLIRHGAGGPTGYLAPQRDFFIDDLLARIHFIIVMMRWTGLAPWDLEFPYPGSLTSAFLVFLPEVDAFVPQTRNVNLRIAHETG